MSSFGENLRRRRELRGISLDAISNSTKISPRMLRAIEDEQFDQLPGGVFNKGFVRAYARQIGLDEEEAVTDYLAALRESQVQAQTILPNFRAPGANAPAAEHDLFPSDSIHRSNGGHSVQASSLPVAPPPSPERRRSQENRRKESRRTTDRHTVDSQNSGRQISDRLNNNIDQRDRSPSQDLYTSNHFEEEEESDISPAPMSFLNLTSPPPSAHSPSLDHRAPYAAPTPISSRTTPRVPWEAIAAVFLITTLVFAFWTFHNRTRSAATETPVASEASSTPPLPAAMASSPASSPAPSPAPPEARTPPEPRTSPKPRPDSAPRPSAPHRAPTVAASDVTTSVPKPHAQPAAKKPAPVPTFRVVIRADQTSWVSISADGQPVARETLIAPANTAVRATREIVVKAGNSAGISFLFNGKEIPASGGSGDVRTYVFGPNGLRTSAATSNP